MTTSDATFKSWRPISLSVELQGEQPSAEEVRAQAREAGFSEGYAEGVSAGEKKGRDTSDALVKQLVSLLDSLDKPFKDIELEVSEYLLSIVLHVCRSILRKELSANLEYIEQTLKLALELLAKEEGQVTCFLNPDDLAMLTANWSEDLGDFSFVEDRQMIGGGCRVQRGDSLVDASLESQLKNLIANFATGASAINQSESLSNSLDPELIELKANEFENEGEDE